MGLFARVGRDTLDLLRIEDCVDTMNWPARRVIDCLPSGHSVLRFRLRAFITELPKLDVRTFLAFPHLPAVLLRLAVAQPSRIFIASLYCDCHEMEGIAAAIRPFGVRIEREFKGLVRIPWFLPRCRALFQHLDDGICDFLPEVPLDGGCCFSHYSPSRPKSASGNSGSKPDPFRASPPKV